MTNQSSKLLKTMTNSTALLAMSTRSQVRQRKKSLNFSQFPHGSPHKSPHGFPYGRNGGTKLLQPRAVSKIVRNFTVANAKNQVLLLGFIVGKAITSRTD